ncbi:hypothetical protein [Kitasatospora purpeofusca]|uniref:hypothetical protein n=1 Tax=Kitasatospora purpeofusca TaxID=67352 RepID=UPI0035D98142
MRPARVQHLLLDAAAGLPAVSGRTFADDGRTRHPFGITIEAAGRTSHWQIAVISAPGENLTSEEDPDPVLGEKPPAMEAPALTDDLATVERALVAQLLATDPGEIASADLYSTRPAPPRRPSATERRSTATTAPAFSSTTSARTGPRPPSQRAQVVTPTTLARPRCPGRRRSPDSCGGRPGPPSAANIVGARLEIDIDTLGTGGVGGNCCFEKAGFPGQSGTNGVLVVRY